MIRLLSIFTLLCLSMSVIAQERSLNDLYTKTLQVSKLINHADYVQALDRADKILGQYSDFRPNSVYFTYLHMYKASAYMALGDLMLSSHCYSLALEYARKSENHEIQFAIRNNLAVLDLERQNYQECFDQCLVLWFDEGFQPELDQQAAVLNNLAICAVRLNNKTAADSLFPQLFAISETELPFVKFDPVLPYRNYGQFLRQLGRDKEAVKYFSIALNRFMDSLGLHHFQTGQSYLYLGECYQAIGNLDSARICFDHAVNILDPDSLFVGTATYELIRIKAYRTRASFWVSISRVERALADIEKAIERIEFIMRYYTSTESGFAVAMVVRPVYNLAIELALTLFQRNNENKYFFKALMYSDQAKRMSLQTNYQNLYEVELSPQLEKAYRSFYATRLALSKKHESPSDLAGLVQQHSENRIYMDSILGFSDLMASARQENNQINQKDFVNPLLSFYDLDTTFRVLFLNGRKTDYYEITKTTKLKETIHSFKSLISKTRTGNYGQAELQEYVEYAAYLYEVLIRSTDWTENGPLYIQADGELNGLPFGAFVDLKGSDSQRGLIHTFKDLPYLIRKNPVFYVSSVSKSTTPHTNLENGLSLIMASGDSSLSASESEINALQSHFKDKFLYGLKQRSKILHFIVHADVDLSNPYNSVLSNGYSWLDILGMDNRGKQVYLNACQTGVGRYNSGEGFMSLGLAFLLSGAQQVVETYWMAPERQSADIAIGFYQSKGFKNPAKALQSSKLQYLDDAEPGLDHPHYWAGAMIQGRIGFESSQGDLIFLLLGIFLIGILLYLLYRFRTVKNLT